MTIETKFAPGDEVWMIECNVVVSRIVQNVETGSSHKGTHIVYDFFDCDKSAVQERLFPTKAELLASL